MIKDVFNILIDRKAFFASLLLEHIMISLTSIIIASLIGLLLGVLISEYKKLSKSTLMIINFIYTIPSISLLGFLIPLSGIGNLTAIIALSIYALLPMVRNTYSGIVDINPAIIEAACAMGSTNLQVLYKIKLPLALNSIITGLKNMSVMTIALAGIASFIGAGGLGVAIYRGITTNNTAMTIAGSLLIALLAFIVDAIISIIQKRFRKMKTLILSLLTLIILGFILSFAFSFMKKDKIEIATKPMTEQYILGNILKELIEHDTNLEVNITEGVGGGTANIQIGMQNGEFDIYPEYTGTSWNAVLKKDTLYTEDMFNILEDEYKSKFDFSLLGSYGFNNTYGLALNKDIAKKYKIKTYSDLAPYAKDLVFGAEYDFFERPDGYDKLANFYNLKFKKKVDMSIGLKYKAIKEGQIDLMNIFTTDGQLSNANVITLIDDKNLYPSYMSINVVRNEILQKYPELRAVLEKLDSTINDSLMSKMNYEVESKNREAKKVAHEFLIEKGLLKDGLR